MATKARIARKPRMTAEEATSFDRYSVGNAVAVKSALACGCEPYADVFTFPRWIAQGFVVRKGQKAIKIPVIVSKIDTESNETIKLFRASAVFCRCQVILLSDKPQSAAGPTEPANVPPTEAPTSEPQRAPKIATPQIDALPGSAPLGIPPIEAPEIADEIERVRDVLSGPKPGTFDNMPGKNCRFNWQYERDGRKVKRRKAHADRCGIACTWTLAECAVQLRSQKLPDGRLIRLVKLTAAQREARRSVERADSAKARPDAEILAEHKRRNGRRRAA